MVDYWLADQLGRAWLSARKKLGLRPANQGMPGMCRRVAFGEPLPAGQLWQAQDFAVRVWWRFGMVAVLLMLPVLGIGAAVRPGRVGTDIGAGLLAGLVCVMGVAGAQMVMIRYRADRTRRYLRRQGLQAAAEPLPPGAAGLPRRSDFWVVLVIALGVCAILFFAGTHSAQH